MTPVHFTGLSDIAILLAGLWLAYHVASRALRRSKSVTTPLRGPAGDSYLWGSDKLIFASEDVSVLHEQWREEYGPVYRVASSLGKQRIVIMDPKAVAHFFARLGYGYIQNDLSRMFIEKLFGRGLLSAEGDSHKRQRKALSPAFSNAAIRRLTSVFYDSTYKAIAAWDASLTGGEDIIDVQNWMNHISLDSIGIAGFSHDFRSLDGIESSVVRVFRSFERDSSPNVPLTFLLTPILPWVFKLPTKRKRLLNELRNSMSELATQLLAKTNKEDVEDKSIIGLLIKAENESEEQGAGMSHEEIVAQMNVLLLAGYETTSISLTWTLIELSRNPLTQDKLREELLSKTGSVDPTYEQLMSTTELPYLDAVVHEILRLHPPVSVTNRVATEDDIIPLSQPITTATGQTTTSIAVAKGTVISAPIRAINRLDAFWGDDAKTFRPERWLEEEKDMSLEFNAISGHRNLLTFIDGPRTCLGKTFALVEFKAALNTLIRNYTFEFPNGPDTELKKCMSVLPRPKVAGETGSRVPLRVKRVL